MSKQENFWPVLVISGQFNESTNEGFRLRELEKELTQSQDIPFISALTYEDGYKLFQSRADFGAILIDWEIEKEKTQAIEIVRLIRKRNTLIPIILFTDSIEVGKIPKETLEDVNECIWKREDTVSFLAGRIERHVLKYIESVYPPFFGELVKYAREYKYAWHTPGHMGGTGFLRSPSGAAFFKFFGENVFRSDLSISVPELGSLLDHSGACGNAETNSAKTFGADLTYYVLNGTSNANQIIWRSQVTKDDIAFVDRNCHKSLNYAMVITDACPIYMIPRRNKMGIIGPVFLSEFKKSYIKKKIQENKLIENKDKTVKMSALTNSTYDGICYNIKTIKSVLEKSVENLHFDEAWYAYAHFHPIYKDHYGMENSKEKEHPPIFCSQSTHKLLTAFSQASMIHIKQGTDVKIEPDEFNESYMMHGSTSPQYTIIASLDVATRMMQTEGKVLSDDVIKEAIRLRKNVVKTRKEFEKEKTWFFDLWQPKSVETMGVDELSQNQKYWVFSRKDPWHGFKDIEDKYAMLDPIKLTFISPERIPAAVVTNYLMEQGIVCEKTDYTSFLLLNSLGTTESKQSTLLSQLIAFKRLYDRNAPMEEVFPEMTFYRGMGLKDHCNAIHEYYEKHHILEKMHDAFEVIPDQAMKPSDAYKAVVKKNVEYVYLDEMMERIPAVMMVPYPPGIPIIMGGEKMNEKAKPILDYLSLRQDFEEKFPGYESDIHGVERDGTRFKTLCIKEEK